MGDAEKEAALPGAMEAVPVATATVVSVTAADAAAQDWRADLPAVEACADRAVQEMGFPKGLALTLARESRDCFTTRIWIVDNSGSMATADGHRIISDPRRPDRAKVVDATRWDELRHSVLQAGKLASLLGAQTQFRLLNPPGSGAQQTVTICDAHSMQDVEGELEQLQRAMATSPSGLTPLTRHIQDIQAQIAAQAEHLERTGEKVVLVIATDGVPSGSSGGNDQDGFIRALRSLQGLPVQLVVQLCTDDSTIGNFWNSIDSELELPLDVLDDFLAEAEEVCTLNPWLVYTEQLHMARTFGLGQKVFDLLDERKLLPTEIMDFLKQAMGWTDLPEPTLDLRGFDASVTEKLRELGPVWNPVTQGQVPSSTTAPCEIPFLEGATLAPCPEVGGWGALLGASSLESDLEVP
eukprot:CAMPEP_0118963238 /NCGR_PEP_ID=MMETSP1173-20130426/1227_1 /TAXON_ID=1034831 /ORGANISM="Rhizochromulina marina cf, Strain CCMP1243" /LENGTH=409 /DNA_ID=CAMNT_0006911559 /DNA_START=53 /DNA_END=1280 /DNA_ORIENTATION=+